MYLYNTKYYMKSIGIFSIRSNVDMYLFSMPNSCKHYLVPIVASRQISTLYLIRYGSTIDMYLFNTQSSVLSQVYQNSLYYMACG